MSAPQRWKDDPSFKAETGLDLADEASAVGGYALNSMRSSVVASTSTTPTGGGGVALAGAAVVALVAAWMWAPLPKVAVVPVPPAHVAAEPVGVPDTPPEASPASGAAEDPESTPPTLAVSGAAPRRAAHPTKRPEAASSAAPVASTAPNEDEEGTAEAPKDRVEPQAPSSDLALQLEVYGAGQRALEAGDLSAATEAYQRYLEAWPEGQVRDEVLVSVLEIVVRRQQWDQAEALSEQLMAVEQLSGRHLEFRRVRSEALSQLGRCAEALKLAESLSRPDALAVKQRCRRAHP